MEKNMERGSIILKMDPVMKEIILWDRVKEKERFFMELVRLLTLDRWKRACQMEEDQWLAIRQENWLRLLGWMVLTLLFYLNLTDWYILDIIYYTTGYSWGIWKKKIKRKLFKGISDFINIYWELREIIFSASYFLFYWICRRLFFAFHLFSLQSHSFKLQSLSFRWFYPKQNSL